MTKCGLLIGLVATVLSVATMAAPVSATSGGLNAEGCHNDRKGGTGYHCHRGPSRSAPATSISQARPLSLFSAEGGRAFRSCAAARAAGAAPVRAGDPGYGRHLDRDGDGVGCE